MSKAQNATEQELAEYFAKGRVITYVAARKTNSLAVTSLRDLKAKTSLQAMQQDLRQKKKG